MRKFYYMFAGAAMMAASFASADEQSYLQITGDELRQTFEGQTFRGEYRNSIAEHITYTEFHDKNGTTEYIAAGEPPTIGNWLLVGDDKICYRYPNHETLTGTYCFFTYKLGTCYYSYAQVDMTLKGPKNWDFWASRSVPKGSGGSCAAQVS